MAETGSTASGRQGEAASTSAHIIWGAVELSETSSVTRNSSSCASACSNGSGRQGESIDVMMSAAKELRRSMRRKQPSKGKQSKGEQKVQEMVDAGQVVVRQVSRSSSGNSAEEAKQQPQASSDQLPDGGPPLHERKARWSAGSKLHDDGECRPCAWVWKPNGCSNGLACTFCHACSVGILKMRKKQKIAKLKAEAAEAAAANGDGAEADGTDDIDDLAADMARTAKMSL